MRPPSIELLRALRSTLSPLPARTRQRACSQTLPKNSFHLQSKARNYTTSSLLQNAARARNPYAPTHRDRGPKSSEDTQTDFGVMDVLGHVAAPATSVDACTSDGFHLDNGVKTEGGAGILLVGGEAFTWQPWLMLPNSEGTQPHLGSLLNSRKGILSFPTDSLGLLELVHPKPDLLIVGTGGKLWMLERETRRYINEVLGCRLDVMDTANAAAAYNLLAKERGIEDGAGVGALLLPVGWIGPKRAGMR